MPVPKVSHRNWWLTQANAQIAMGNEEIDSRGLSFIDCLQLIVPPGGTPYKERAKDGSYSHKEWSSVKIEWEIEDRERAHRPNMDKESMEEWVEIVGQEWPNIPIESLSFDEQLELLLKRRHEWFKRLSTDIVIKNTATGELFRATSSTGAANRDQCILD